MSCGGLSEKKEADTEVQDICNEVRASAEEKAGTSFEYFEARHYCSQVVAGTNFYIKVHVGDTSYVHIKVYRNLPYQGSTSRLIEIQVNKTESDPLNYF